MTKGFVILFSIISFSNFYSVIMSEKMKWHISCGEMVKIHSKILKPKNKHYEANQRQSCN